MKPINRRKFVKISGIGTAGTVILPSLMGESNASAAPMASEYTLAKNLKKDDKVFVKYVNMDVSEGYRPQVTLDGLVSGNVNGIVGEAVQSQDNPMQYTIPVYFETGDQNSIDDVVIKKEQVDTAARRVLNTTSMNLYSRGSNIEVEFNLKDNYDDATIKLSDMNGRVLRQENAFTHEGLNKVSLGSFSDLANGYYNVTIDTPDGKRTSLRYAPGTNVAHKNNEETDRFADPWTKSAEAEEGVRIIVDDVPEKIGHVIADPIAGKLTAVDLKSESMDVDFEMLGYSDNLTPLDLIEVTDNIYASVLTPSDDPNMINKEFWIKYFSPVIEGDPSVGYETTINHIMDKYESKLTVAFEDGSSEKIRIPNQTARDIYLATHPEWDGQELPYLAIPESYNENNEGHAEIINNLADNLANQMAKPLEAEWLKNINDTLTSDGNGGLYSKWNEDFEPHIRNSAIKTHALYDGQAGAEDLPGKRISVMQLETKKHFDEEDEYDKSYTIAKNLEKDKKSFRMNFRRTVEQTGTVPGLQITVAASNNVTFEIGEAMQAEPDSKEFIIPVHFFTLDLNSTDIFTIETSVNSGPQQEFPVKKIRIIVDDVPDSMDHILSTPIAGKLFSVDIRSHPVDAEVEMMGYSENLEPLGLVEVSNDIYAANDVPSDDPNMINKEFWIKYFSPVIEGDPSVGYETTINHIMDKYEARLSIVYDDDSRDLSIAVPNQTARDIYLATHPEWDGQELPFLETQEVYDYSIEGQDKKVSDLANNLANQMAKPLEAEWLKNINDTLTSDGNGGLYSKWNEDLEPRIRDSAIKTHAIYTGQEGAADLPGKKIVSIGLETKKHF